MICESDYPHDAWAYTRYCRFHDSNSSLITLFILVRVISITPQLMKAPGFSFPGLRSGLIVLSAEIWF